jgi:hypothetical protein
MPITSTPPPPPSGSAGLDAGFDEDPTVDAALTSEMVELGVVDLEITDLESGAGSDDEGDGADALAETAAQTTAGGPA